VITVGVDLPRGVQLMVLSLAWVSNMDWGVLHIKRSPSFDTGLRLGAEVFLWSARNLMCLSGGRVSGVLDLLLLGLR